MMDNYKMTIAYDGRRYKGFRKTKNSGEMSIQGKLEKILEKKYEKEIEVIGAVNTDAGVHATEQIVNFKVPEGDSPEAIRAYFEAYLPEDIITLSIDKVDDRFQSRYQMKSATYEYRLWRSDCQVRPLFDRQRINRVDEALTVGLMKEGAKLLIGEHDFTAFSTKSKVKSSIKEIFDVSIESDENEVVIRMTANSYLLNMERIIVGTLIQIGFCQRDFDDIELAFTTLDRKYVGHKVSAPALTLVGITYE